MVKLAVLVSGGGTNLQSIIDSIEAGRLEAELKVVLSDNPQAYALQRAKKHSIPTEVVSKTDFPGSVAFNSEIARRLKNYGVELVALAGFMRIIGPAVLEAFPMRVINIHPSLLPSFPGLDVQRKAIEHGVKLSGCTVHFVDAGVDSGPVIIQAAVPVLDADTPETLAARILKEEHRIYPRAIQLFSEGRLKLDGRRVVIEGASPSAEAIENPESTES